MQWNYHLAASCDHKICLFLYPQVIVPSDMYMALYLRFSNLFPKNKNKKLSDCESILSSKICIQAKPFGVLSLSLNFL